MLLNSRLLSGRKLHESEQSSRRMEASISRDENSWPGLWLQFIVSCNPYNETLILQCTIYGATHYSFISISFQFSSHRLNSICNISAGKVTFTVYIGGLKLSQTIFVLRGIRAFTVRSSFKPVSTGRRPAGQDFCACAVAAAQAGQEDQSLSSTTVTLKNRRLDPT